jgi:hypothetical protein
MHYARAILHGENDGEDLGVPVLALDGVPAGVAVAAEDLDGLLGDADRVLAELLALDTISSVTRGVHDTGEIADTCDRQSGSGHARALCRLALIMRVLSSSGWWLPGFSARSQDRPDGAGSSAAQIMP